MAVNIPNIQQGRPLSAQLTLQQIFKEKNRKNSDINAYLIINKLAVVIFATLAICCAVVIFIPSGIVPLAITGSAFLVCFVASKILQGKQNYLRMKKIVDIATLVFAALAICCTVSTAISFGIVPVAIAGAVSLVCFIAAKILQNKTVLLQDEHRYLKKIIYLAKNVFLGLTCYFTAAIVMSSGMVLVAITGAVSLASFIAIEILKYKQRHLKKEFFAAVKPISVQIVSRRKNSVVNIRKQRADTLLSETQKKLELRKSIPSIHIQFNNVVDVVEQALEFGAE